MQFPQLQLERNGFAFLWPFPHILYGDNGLCECSFLEERTTI